MIYIENRSTVKYSILEIIITYESNQPISGTKSTSYPSYLLVNGNYIRVGIKILNNNNKKENRKWKHIVI